MTMNYKLFNILTFATGAAIGSVATWKFLKTKYEQITREEIESMKEYYSRKYDTENIEESETSVVANMQDKPDLMEYAAQIAKEHGYTHYSNSNEEENMDDVVVVEPYVISPEEFDEMEYETVTLTLYADGVLTDELDNIIEDPDGIVGSDIESHFGEYQEDTVFVRNDEQEIDYEICRDERNYSDVVQ